MNTPNDTVHRLLDHFEQRLDLAHLERSRARHLAALNYESVDAPPLVCYLKHTGQGAPMYAYPKAFADPAKMMVNELLQGFTSPYLSLGVPDDAPYCLRPNLGTTIIASMFGADIRLLEDNLPWVERIGEDRIRQLVDEPLPDVRSGLGQRAADQYAYLDHALADYPVCRNAFQCTLPDLQGPIDTAELLWGPDIFVALYTDRDLVLQLLDHVTEQMIAVYRFLRPLIREVLPDGFHHQHGTIVRGNIMLRDDTGMLVSPEMYRDLLAPFNARLAEALGPIGVHYCGNGEHQVDNLLNTPGVECLDFGQPEMNDLDAIYMKASARRAALARLALPEAELLNGRACERFPMGVSFIHEARSVEEARRVCQGYYR